MSEDQPLGLLLLGVAFALAMVVTMQLAEIVVRRRNGWLLRSAAIVVISLGMLGLVLIGLLQWGQPTLEPDQDHGQSDGHGGTQRRRNRQPPTGRRLVAETF